MNNLALTTSQKLVWLGQQLQPESPLNNMAFSIRWQKEIDVNTFQQAFNDLIAATDVMRLQFIDGEAVQQKVTGLSDFELSILKVSEFKDYLQAKSAQPFDLSGYLFDAALLQLAADDYVFYFNQHHLITDGWGMSLQVNWLIARYEFLLGKREESPAKPASFSEYAEEFQAIETAEKTLTQAETWKKKVAAYPDLPALFGRKNPEYLLASTRVVHALSEEQTNALNALCMESDVRSWSKDLSLFSVFLTTLYAYVYRISGQRKLTIGAPAHNRLTATDKQVAGLYIELFPLYVEIDEEETFSSLLQKVKAESMTFLRNAKPGSSSTATGRSFNVLFNFINTSFNEGNDPSLSVDWIHPGETETGHHLKLQVYDFANTGRLRICLDINNAILPAADAELVHRQFMETLEQVIQDRNQLISLPGEETRAKVDSFNHQDETYPTGITVPQLIAERCAIEQDRIAVVNGKETLTYRELDEKSNQLAHHLLESGLKPEELVAICLDRSLEMMIGLMGIIKAGGAYVPIDPEYPRKRIDYVLEDTQSRFVITQDKYAGLFTELADEKIIVPGHADLYNLPTSSVTVELDPAQLMYVIYTSGSTGKPKGVMNEHRGLVNRLEFARRAFLRANEREVILQKTTFCFDVSVWELFLPLITGAKLVMAEPGKQGDPQYLKRVIEEQKITLLHFVPPMLQAFLESINPGDLPSLRTVKCSGEALKPEHVNNFNKHLPHVTLHNLYGPTEAAIDVTHWIAPSKVTDCKLVPIGQPIANVPLYVLNDAREFCPVNVPGELYIGGIQVARGYHRRPELNAEKFVDLVFPGATEPVRLYRTGDLTRWLSDGNLEFLGRIDSQVKVRGFRIELGEIENTLAELPGYRQGVVAVRNEMGEGGQLVAYLTTSKELNVAEVKTFLTERLPSYMVPAYVVFLNELPLLPNGKINRKLLPSPAGVAIIDTEPQTQFEEIVMQAWIEVLELSSVGRETSFFDLGGHSLSGIRLMSRINSDFELEMPVATIFRHPTVAALAAHTEATIRQLMAEMDKNV